MLEKFKTEVRLNRGRLTKFDKYIEEIYNNGIEGLKYFTLKKKLMGIANIAYIASQTVDYQEKFVSYMADKHWKATKNELDLWFSENRG